MFSSDFPKYVCKCHNSSYSLLAEVSVVERSAKFIPISKHADAHSDKSLVEIMGNQSCFR